MRHVAQLAVILLACVSVPHAAPRQADVVRLPFESYHRLIFLPVRLNGSAPLSFIFDTGASLTVVHEARARSLGLALRDQRRIAGSDGGEGAINLAMSRGVALDVGGTRFAPDQVGVMSLASAETLLGHAVDGILGGDFIRQYVVDIDYANQMLTLHEPKTYDAARASGGGVTLPLQIVNDYPCVRGRVALAGGEVLDALFAIDTGDGGSGFGLNAPFVTRHKLLDHMHAVPGFAAGISGESRTMTARADSLMLGGVTLRAPIVGLSQSESGAHARTDFDGLLSGEIWRRFRVTLDYGRKQIRLVPNDSVGDPFESDMSGLLLAAEGADFRTLRVTAVRRDSLAEVAGLRAGDILLALDEQPAAQLTLFQVEQQLKQDGREIRLRMRRGADELQVRLVLKRVI